MSVPNSAFNELLLG